jgi:hypothetical protein
MLFIEEMSKGKPPPLQAAGRLSFHELFNVGVGQSGGNFLVYKQFFPNLSKEKHAA